MVLSLRQDDTVQLAGAEVEATIEENRNES